METFIGEKAEWSPPLKLAREVLKKVCIPEYPPCPCGVGYVS